MSGVGGRFFRHDSLKCTHRSMLMQAFPVPTLTTVPGLTHTVSIWCRQPQNQDIFHCFFAEVQQIFCSFSSFFACTMCCPHMKDTSRTNTLSCRQNQGLDRGPETPPPHHRACFFAHIFPHGSPQADWRNPHRTSPSKCQVDSFHPTLRQPRSRPARRKTRGLYHRRQTRQQHLSRIVCAPKNI